MEKCAVVDGADRRRLDMNGSSCSEVKKSRLATPEDWERYQQQIIRSCFDCWEADNELDGPDADGQPADGKTETTDDDAGQERTGQPADESPTQRFRSADVSYEWVDDEFVKPPVAGTDKRKKFPRRKSKRFSFCKYTTRLIRERRQCPWRPPPSQPSPPPLPPRPSRPADNNAQNGTLQSRCSAEDLWQCKKWFDSVEKIPDPPPPPLGFRSEYPFVCPSPAVTVAGHERQAKRRVRKFIDQIKDRSDRSSFGDGSRSPAIGCGTSDKLKRFFKNAFRKNRTDLDPQLLAQSIEYAGQELDKWRTMLHWLEDIKRSRENIKSLAAVEDTIKYKFSEINSAENQRARDDESADDDKSDDGSGEATAPKSETADETPEAANKLDDAECFVRLERANWSTDNELQRSDRRSLSDTNLPAMALDYERAFGSKIVRINRKTLMPNGGDDGPVYPADDADAYGRWSGVLGGLWKEHRECFRTAVARLEFVGSTFKEQYRLTGLKTLCKVDVLAGFGRSAEAVDLFVSVLPLSKNPDLMVRKAEAVYDWKFFCHLCMWRHSYKE